VAEKFVHRPESDAAPPVELLTDSGEGNGLSVCPDCGSSLRSRVPGFRPLTAHERRRLTPEAVRVLGLCPNPRCP
jgi:hypothetical protein